MIRFPKRKRRSKLWSIDRCVLVVMPQKPYLDWVHSLDEEGREYTLEDLREEGTAYLIPTIEDIDKLDETLEDTYESIFAQELAAWHTDPDDWPTGRNLAMFRQWFQVIVCSMTLDTVGEPMNLEEE